MMVSLLPALAHNIWSLSMKSSWVRFYNLVILRTHISVIDGCSVTLVFVQKKLHHFLVHQRICFFVRHSLSTWLHLVGSGLLEYHLLTLIKTTHFLILWADLLIFALLHFNVLLSHNNM